MLHSILETKEEKLYSKKFNRNMENIKKNKKYYDMIDYIENLNLKSSFENKEVIRLVEKYVEQIYLDNLRMNEKFYKNGFKDGVNLIFECFR